MAGFFNPAFFDPAFFDTGIVFERPAADPEAGLVAFLRQSQPLSQMIEGRVYAGELPADETRNMPRKALVLRASGGAQLLGDTYADTDTQRFDLFAFGETPFEAARVMRAAAIALRMMRRGVHGGCLFHWAASAGGSFAGREPVTEWPRHFQSFQIMHGLFEVGS